jgi:hypothetical protein
MRLEIGVVWCWDSVRMYDYGVDGKWESGVLGVGSALIQQRCIILWMVLKHLRGHVVCLAILHLYNKALNYGNQQLPPHPSPINCFIQQDQSDHFDLR